MFIYQLLMIVSIILDIILILIIAVQNDKKQIHFAVMSIAGSLIVWNVAVFMLISFPENESTRKLGEIIYFSAVILVSQAVLFSGIIYTQLGIKFSWKYWILFIVPIVSFAVLFTNDYHHLMYIKFGLNPLENQLGWFYIVHTAYSYVCILLGLLCFLYSAIKNFGFFSRQAFLIFFAILISIIADSFSTFQIFEWSAAIENIVFS